MAKISAEFDTKEKTLVVMMDGKKLENVASVEFYPNWEKEEEFRVGVTTIEKVDDEDLTKVMRIVAQDDGLQLKEEVSNMPHLIAHKLFPDKMV